MLTPTIILLGIFVYYFLGKTVYFSLTDWGENPAQPMRIKLRKSRAIEAKLGCDQTAQESQDCPC